MLPSPAIASSRPDSRPLHSAHLVHLRTVIQHGAGISPQLDKTCPNLVWKPTRLPLPLGLQGPSPRGPIPSGGSPLLLSHGIGGSRLVRK